jgi:predicted transcriptional regulator
MTQAEDDFLKAVGRRWKKLREDRDLSINQVAIGSGLSRPTIKGMEEGTKDWLLTSMGRLCIFYDIAPSTLLEGL